MGFENAEVQSGADIAEHGAIKKLCEEFRKLAVGDERGIELFLEIEQVLQGSGFALAGEPAVKSIMEDSSLYCRSESFTKVMELLLKEQTIDVRNDSTGANMCVMASGEGFRIAMIEGFSGADVGNRVKTVITFEGTHLTKHEHIDSDNELWRVKPDTARVSLEGSGTIAVVDLKMVSFRYPVHFFPSELLTEKEKEDLEDNKISFIVRHYIPHRKTTMH